MSELTDREILELCAIACGIEYQWDTWASAPMMLTPDKFDTQTWNPLTDGNDDASMENKCGVIAGCRYGKSIIPLSSGTIGETFTPGNDAERRRASCLVVARMQQAKEGASHG
ncbi:MAG: hypothetical protein CGU29_17240 [Candidatus Dactylopiibacterium carminicum]|uniref:Uncharacterized protein n=1 Tax=Candidatus Dactylopiibacterium carminicum TaxID=857335 RepID=A0A272EMK2_9RHOO|nr:hypothetical protein [Candidatus Dactylopiibacterium carminicum]KAF7597684.1 hypothetical protein BGI27_17480 [Candidatus Dactylopiibacterium carminicum]PAS91296.1 MAG: hypothetical protein CGU29_17240 [Candidatus Dactylopiibacterium carminicum]PAS93981.1 MAG: hypothetical protein BSR46_17525 [Candidatus Dactylopiibacterium carminicum]